MFAPLIPVLTVFLLACIIMLVGLRLSSKKSSSDPREIDPLPLRSRARQTYRSETVRSRHAYSGRAWASAASPVGAVGEVRGKNLFEVGLEKIPQHLRLPLALILIFCGCLVLLAQASLWSGTGLPISLINAPAQAIPTKAAVATTAPKVQTPVGVSDVSKNVHHIAQMDPSQYSSTDEYNTWAASACSTVSMTVVINAYGHNYRVTDILKVEIEQHAIDPDLGLLEASGIKRTVDKLGFRTLDMSKAPLDSLIAVANNGWPIIIGFPPGQHWPGGHILVVTGGDNNNVYLADSAPSNLPSVTHDRFMQDWGGMALIVMPKDR